MPNTEDRIHVRLTQTLTNIIFTYYKPDIPVKDIVLDLSQTLNGTDQDEDIILLGDFNRRIDSGNARRIDSGDATVEYSGGVARRIQLCVTQ